MSTYRLEIANETYKHIKTVAPHDVEKMEPSFDFGFFSPFSLVDSVMLYSCCSFERILVGLALLDPLVCSQEVFSYDM